LIRRRVYLRPEGWYYCFVIAFVVGGAVLRNVNLLVALAGLMVAALILHWQMVLRSLSGIDILRSFPGRICAGDTLEVEVSLAHRGNRGLAWALEYKDYFERIDPPDGDPASEVALLFPRIRAGEKVTKRFRCEITRRGVYRFSRAALASRYPLGLVEGVCFLDLPDRLVVYPRMGLLHRRWEELVEAEQSGQQSTRHRQGLSEGDFYALREWRNGDSRRWVHWRTSAKLGTLAVRQFEQRRSCDVSLILDLWQPPVPTDEQRAVVENAISFAATAVVELGRRGGSRLGLVVASREVGRWAASASPLFAQELLEHLAVCRGSETVRLTEALQQLADISYGGAKVLVVSTRSRDDALQTLDRRVGESLKSELLDQAVWLNAAAGDFDSYFTPGWEARA
jgi:uncharacterized protein (DUF58 family)